MNEPLIESGFAVTRAGVWLTGRGQPAAVRGRHSVEGLKGFIGPDRRHLAVLRNESEAYLSSADRPFLSHIVSTGSLAVVSSKILLAPFKAREGARLLRVIPLSFRESFPVTRFKSDWVVAATASRVKRIVLEDGEVLCAKRESVVAWTGNDPVGVAGRVKLRDIFLPKRKVSLSLDFYGPQVVWMEGSNVV